MNKVQLEFQVLNNKLEKLFERLSKFSNEQLNQKVIDGKWSINENIYHLMTIFHRLPFDSAAHC